MTDQVTLGGTYTDQITGFTGICTGLCQYITGCNQALLSPKAKDGALVEAQWFDEQRLIGDDTTSPLTLLNGGNPGFDKAAPKR